MKIERTKSARFWSARALRRFCRIQPLCCLLTLALLPSLSRAQQTFAERLGWPKDTTAVILHVDDVGMSHASNLGAIESIEKGSASSFSIMMPCPWVPEIARWLAKNTNADSGLHLTLTSEWQIYRWGPVAGKKAVPGLVDNEGCMWRSVPQVTTRATPDEIETEIRAQIEKAQGYGFQITHLDSHMGTLFARPDYFERFLKVGVEKQIPILAIGGHMTYVSQRESEASKQLRPLVPKIWNAGLPVIDDLHTGWTGQDTMANLRETLNTLKPGVTMIIFHASHMTEEFPLITGSAKGRQIDLDALTNPETKEILKRRNIILTTWRECMQRRQKAQPINEAEWK
jgi:chitin disaccharide deacetylase